MWRNREVASGARIESVPPWTPSTFSAADNAQRADVGVGAILNSIDADLTPFRSRGGKLIQYAGWSDSAISPRTRYRLLQLCHQSNGGAGAHCRVLSAVHGARHGPIAVVDRVQTPSGKAPTARTLRIRRMTFFRRSTTGWSPERPRNRSWPRNT